MADVGKIIFHKNKGDDLMDKFYCVKVMKYGKHLDIIACDSQNDKKPHCKKLADGTYVNTVTGEFLTAQKFENRNDSFYLLRKSADQLYKFIHMNFYNNTGYHAVLTYSTPPVNTKEVYHDFKIFWQKIRYRYPSLGYISVLEPNQRGIWHLHVLLRDMKNPYSFISFHDIRECWQKGIIYISKMHKKVDYGNYFRKKINRSNELLKLYEPGVRYFRHSRNIVKPLSYKTSISTIEDIIESGNYEVVDQYSLSVNQISKDGEESTVNKIYYKFLLRKDK